MTAAPTLRDTGQDFDSDDAVAVSSFLDAAYGNSLRLQADPGRLMFRRADLGPVSVDHMTLSGEVRFATDRISRFTVMECRTGTGRYDRAGLTDRLSPGEVVATAAPGDSYSGYCGALELRLLNLDLDALEVAALESRGTEGPLRFHGLRATTHEDALRWGRLIDFVELTAERGRTAGLAERELARVVARTALQVFPNSTWDEPSGTTQRRDGRDGSAVAVRRACGYIDSMADRDVTLADIAAAAHLSPRALQLAFRRHLGITPMQRLQDVRLQEARRELLAADAPSVARVASRWGFSNHGRFAALYRDAFGELPSRTLGRAVGDDGADGADQREQALGA